MELLRSRLSRRWRLTDPQVHVDFDELPDESAQGRLLLNVPMARGALGASPISGAVYRELIRLIFEQGSILLLGGLFTALILITYFYDHMAPQRLGVWFLAIILVTLLRLLLQRSFHHSHRQHQIKGRDWIRWGRRHWLMMLLTSLVWGSLPWVLGADLNTESALLLGAVFAGMITINAASGCLYLPAFVAFSYPLALPIVVLFLSSGDQALRAAGLLLVFFVFVATFLARRGNRYMVSLIHARIEHQVALKRICGERDRAEQAVITRNRMVAGLSHDLRQPLHAVRLLLSALRSREDHPTKLSIVDDISLAATSLNDMLSSLIDVARLDGELLSERRVSLPIDLLCRRLHDEYQHAAKARGVELNCSVASARVFADEMLVERVLRNLLSNAVQNTPQGSISILGRCQDARYRLSISDTGPGIPADRREAVFEEGERGEAARGLGLGLGLSIVQRLCRFMQVPIQLEPNPDAPSGCCFTLSFELLETNAESTLPQALEISALPLPERHRRRPQPAGD